MTVTAAHAAAFLEHLLARDLAAATELAVGLADEGTTVADIALHLIAPAQAEIGERWHRDELGVADEHAASAVSDAVLSVVASTARPADGRRVEVVCVQGEWHLLPARLLVEVLRADGCHVTFLGGSTPATHLARTLERSEPDVVALSCSTPLALDGVIGAVHVAHDLGIPVLAGGRALGRDERRARVLGADLWAPDGAAAAELLRLPPVGPTNAPTADTGTALELALRRDGLVEAAMTALERRFPPLVHYSAHQLARTREDFGFILQFAEAAILTRDRRVFDEFITWLDALLAARGLPPAVLGVSIEVLATVSDDPALLPLLTPHAGAERAAET